MTPVTKLGEGGGGGNKTFIKLYTNNREEGKRPYFLNTMGDKDEMYEDVSGEFKGIEFQTYEYEKKGETKTAENAKLHIVDTDTERVIQMGWSSLSRSILNSLLSADSIGTISIQLYLNKGGYAGAVVKADDEKLGWAIEDWQEMVEKKTLNGDEVSDYTKYDETLKEKTLEKFPLKEDNTDEDSDEEDSEQLPF